jgi:calcineurin-like phosphoesterase family protein
MLKFVDEDGVPFRGHRFSNQKECDDLMIDNWNSVIKEQDIVWHLGDVFMGDKESFCKLWTKLNGHKRLIVGNHDDIRFLSGKNPENNEWFFQKIHLWRKWPEYDMIMTHVPMQLNETYEGTQQCFNVHGHIHNNESPSMRHWNACVEPNDYKPVNLEDLTYHLQGVKEKYGLAR